MYSRFSLLLLIVFTSISFPLHAAKIGLLIVATGKYDQFIPRLINSARTYFCPGEQVTYYVFADGVIPEGNDIVSIYQKRLGWPLDTLMRNDIYARHQERFQQEDYLFAIDADMLFVDVVGREILGTRVATRHPGFMNQRGTYETNPQSQAYVKDTEGTHYYAGAFFGGTRESFLHIISETTRRIQLDLQQSMIAIWHDESHWNRYCIDHPPTVILSPSYCYPESQKLDYQRKLLALDKNHAAFRSPN